MKREAKNTGSERECGCKSGNGSADGRESCCQTKKAHPETSHNHEHSHGHGSEHNCGHNCDCN